MGFVDFFNKSLGASKRSLRGVSHKHLRIFIPSSDNNADNQSNFEKKIQLFVQNAFRKAYEHYKENASLQSQRTELLEKQQNILEEKAQLTKKQEASIERWNRPRNYCIPKHHLFDSYNATQEAKELDWELYELQTELDEMDEKLKILQQAIDAQEKHHYSDTQAQNRLIAILVRKHNKSFRIYRRRRSSDSKKKMTPRLRRPPSVITDGFTIGAPLRMRFPTRARRLPPTKTARKTKSNTKRKKR